ncbi:sensor histidine kinase [Nocardia sp. NPDC058176]|uniref:sensor histidine kinase n=1 Tax=Nocardia sp. NPDC058176 TaxID=3346368 RepID=UPI0036D76E21
MTESSTEVLDVAPSPAPAATGSVLRAVALAPFQARTWKELGYLIAAYLVGALGICYLFFGLGGGLLVAVLVVGVPVLALVILGSRVWGTVYRALVRTLLDTPLESPPPFRPKRGLIGFLTGAFTDLAAWRALAFLIVQAVLGVIVGYFVLVAIAVAVFTAISPVFWAIGRPMNVDADGVERQSMVQFDDFYFDTWPRVLGLGAVGVLGCFVLPWLIRVVCLAHRQVAIWLLTPTDRERMAHLRESRRVAVEDSAATLRRVERDLHDGAQARLVTIAMALGRAEDRVARGDDASDLIADAHSSSKEALVELRELVRGIHPPALELGLEPALETLSARCAVPVELRYELIARPSPAIEAIAYFSVAELLTNVVRHADANHVLVSVVPTGARLLTVTVRDNGIGGAPRPDAGIPGAGSGLAGLAARAGTVDGTMTVDSAPGGPTVITLTLPLVEPR